MLPLNYLLNAHYPLKGKLGDKVFTLFHFQKWRKYNCNHSFRKKKRANVELAYMYSNLLFFWTILGCMLLHVKKQENSMYVSCQIAKKNNTSYTQCKNGSCSICSEEKLPMVRFPAPPPPPPPKKNTKTIRRMTRHCFLRPIRRDLASYEQLLHYPQKWLLDYM